MNNQPNFYEAPEEATFYTAEADTPAAQGPITSPAILRPAISETFSKVGLSLLVLTIGLTVASYVVQFILMAVFPSALEHWSINWILSLIPLYACGLPLMLLVLRSSSKAPHNTEYVVDKASGTLAPKPAFTFGTWMLLLVIALGFMYIGSLIGNAIMAILSLVTGFDYANGLNTLIGESPIWMTVIGTCICAPLGEEFIFRKLLIDRTRAHGDLISILFSGFLFGLFHANLFQFFYAFFLGVILAYIYTRTGNLWWCVGMHAAMNLLGGVVMPQLQSLLPTDPTAQFTPFQLILNMGLSLYIYGAIIAAIVLLIVLWKKIKLSAGPLPAVKGARAASVLNPGMILALVVMTLSLLANLVLPILLWRMGAL